MDTVIVDGLKNHIRLNLPTDARQFESEVLSCVEEIISAFSEVTFEYFAQQSFDMELEQHWITKYFNGKGWPELIGRRICRNLSLLYSLDDRSFIYVLPALLVTSFYNVDAFHTAIGQLIPGTIEFYGRTERLNSQQHKAIRNWLLLIAKYQELPMYPDIEMYRIKQYWQIEPLG